MQVGFAYTLVVLIWATTPLAIQWSNSSLSFIAAVSIRMFVALCICVAILALLRKPLVKKRSDWLVFLAAALGFFPTMAVVYWSSQYVASGLVAVLFGLYPFAVGFFSLFILGENIFNFRRVIALTIAVVGLTIINGEQFAQGSTQIMGVLGLIGAVSLFGLSSVWLKSIGQSVDAFRQLTGALMVSTPCFVLLWAVVDGDIPTYIDFKSLTGVGYLAIAGSVISQTAFFYVVANCRVSIVGLITLLTPLLALVISIFFAKEYFSQWMFIGSMLIVLSLAIYQGISFKRAANFAKLSAS